MSQRLTCVLQRWREALDPGIKRGPWAEHEDDKLITMFRTHGRKWNDIAVSLDGRPPVQVHPIYFRLVEQKLTSDSQCRNRWLSLVRAGKIEDDAPVKPEHRQDPFFYLSASSAEVRVNPFNCCSVLTYIVCRLLTRPRLRTPQEATPHPFNSHSVGLFGKSIKQAPRTTTTPESTSYTLLLIRRANTTNIWFSRIGL